jgi:hypothetical protein
MYAFVYNVYVYLCHTVYFLCNYCQRHFDVDCQYILKPCKNDKLIFVSYTLFCHSLYQKLWKMYHMWCYDNKSQKCYFVSHKVIVILLMQVYHVTYEFVVLQLECLYKSNQNLFIHIYRQ